MVRLSDFDVFFILARQDECPESYCHTPCIGMLVHQNFDLAYNSWTTIEIAFIFHMCIPCAVVTRPFQEYHKFWPSDLDLGVWPAFEKL